MEKEKGIGPRQMLRDVTMAAIETGQLPVMLGGVVAIIVSIRIPEQDLGWLVRDFYTSARDGTLFGYGLAIVAITGWVYHVRFLLRSTHQTGAKKVANKGQDETSDN